MTPPRSRTNVRLFLAFLLGGCSTWALTQWPDAAAQSRDGDDRTAFIAQRADTTGAATSNEDHHRNPIDDLYDRVTPALVEVLVDDHLNGSGWIATTDGLVVTAAHVVDAADRRIEILVPDVGRLPAKKIAEDVGHDLALLELPKRDGGYPALPLAERMPKPGNDIYQFGAPIYRHAVMLRGCVARDEPAFEYLADHHTYIEAFHVTADTPRGTSGGPWVDRAGRVVGLQSGMMRDNNAQAGISFVTPVEAITQLVRTKQSAQTMSVGMAVEELWEQPWDFLKRFPRRTEGLVVRQLKQRGPADDAGLKEMQVILAVNDRPVTHRDAFLALVRDAKPGDEMKLTILKADSVKRYTVTLKPQRLED